MGYFIDTSKINLLNEKEDIILELSTNNLVSTLNENNYEVSTTKGVIIFCDSYTTAKGYKMSRIKVGYGEDKKRELYFVIKQLPDNSYKVMHYDEKSAENIGNYNSTNKTAILQIMDQYAELWYDVIQNPNGKSKDKLRKELTNKIFKVDKEYAKKVHHFDIMG